MCHDLSMPDAGTWIARHAVVLCTAGLLAGCGNGAEAEWSKEPVGSALLPDFAPEPPTDLHTKRIGDVWTVEFSSTVVNVGDGDFHATADKQLDGSWILTQDIEYDGGGAEHIATDAEAVWAGDGHEHWHVKRYVVYHLFALDQHEEITGAPRTDHKVGFCIYDFERAGVEQGSDEPVYDRKGCGRKDSSHLVMGLSPGWADHYNWDLPGQSIPIGGLADGEYRIFAVADEGGVFREETTENNETWVDFTLSSDAQGNRFALLGDVGPSPE